MKLVTSSLLAVLAALLLQAKGQEQPPPEAAQLRGSGAARSVQAKLADGTSCLLGTTCNSCQSPATWWWGKFSVRCGTEPKWENGVPCLLGSSCNACRNPATLWSSKRQYACGTECWAGGVACDQETTCKKCCSDYGWRWTDWNQGYVSCNY
jgi:hypothetical protein